MPTYTAIVTLLAIAFYFFLATRVAVAHGKFNVRLPAMSGNPDFERIYRIHANTLEWMPTFLVPLWLCAVYLSDIGAAAVGPDSSCSRRRASCSSSARRSASSCISRPTRPRPSRRKIRHCGTARQSRHQA
jgi:MAPEG family